MIRENSSICREWFNIWMEEVSSKFVWEIGIKEEKKILGFWLKGILRDELMKEILGDMIKEKMREKVNSELVLV